MILCSTCLDALAEPGSRRCVQCATGRPADARTTVIAAPAALPDVPARIETAKVAILGVLDDGGPLTGTQISHALSSELRQHFAPAAAELTAAGVITFTTNRHSCTYELARP
ncbi:hypothetical protein AWC23_16460 [Mycobacterium saskatchewanense]|uniref:Uncharacterized protein n=1 Tax=Mycobacterium saskatchewanense TaxID=220927 RepID=A0AAJ3NPB5_9MYCO|nr:hypothetical protein AWC23_16460 [Mycobacterium saskatchewanense]